MSASMRVREPNSTTSALRPVLLAAVSGVCAFWFALSLWQVFGAIGEDPDVGRDSAFAWISSFFIAGLLCGIAARAFGKRGQWWLTVPLPACLALAAMLVLWPAYAFWPWEEESLVQVLKAVAGPDWGAAFLGFGLAVVVGFVVVEAAAWLIGKAWGRAASLLPVGAVVFAAILAEGAGALPACVFQGLYGPPRPRAEMGLSDLAWLIDEWVVPALSMLSAGAVAGAVPSWLCRPASLWTALTFGLAAVVLMWAPILHLADGVPLVQMVALLAGLLPGMALAVVLLHRLRRRSHLCTVPVAPC